VITSHPDYPATEQEELDGSRATPEEIAPGQTHPVAFNVPGLVRWLSGFFSLTEEERLQAGIYVGGEGRDG
jgi:hypothetical protein